MKPKSERFIERYNSGETPWELGRPDFNLVNLIMSRPIGPCTLLDIGCGNGNDALWLARNGFTVIGTDISPTAVKTAEKRAAEAGVTCTFLVGDFLKDKISGGPFAFLYDRGCFHSFDTPEERAACAEIAASLLQPEGLWFSLIGSADDEPREMGPPMRTAVDVVIAVEPYFEILSLKAGLFDTDRQSPPKAFTCLMKKR